MTLASQGAQAKFAMEPLDGAFDTSSEPYEFVSETMKARKAIQDTDGTRGTRSHHSSRTRFDVLQVGGQVTLHPSPADLDLLLPRILGAAESTDTFALDEALPAFGVMVDRVAKVWTYGGCYVNKATFRSKAGPGSFVELILDIIGTTGTYGNAGTFPALTYGVAANNAPYVFSDAVLTIVGGAKAMMDFEIVIDNQLEARFSNSANATSITPKNRIVTLKTTNPFTSDETGVLQQSVGGTTGTVVLTNGAMSTTFTFAVLQCPWDDPNVSGKTEIKQTLEMVARMTATTRELVVTHDSVA